MVPQVPQDRHTHVVLLPSVPRMAFPMPHDLSPGPCLGPQPPAAQSPPFHKGPVCIRSLYQGAAACKKKTTALARLDLKSAPAGRVLLANRRQLTIYDPQLTAILRAVAKDETKREIKPCSQLPNRRLLPLNRRPNRRLLPLNRRRSTPSSRRLPPPNRAASIIPFPKGGLEPKEGGLDCLKNRQTALQKCTLEAQYGKNASLGGVSVSGI